MDFALTDEQSDFVDAIRDFCDRECGTQEQRERLTDGYARPPQLDALPEDGRPRLARGDDPRGVRRLGRRDARRLPVHGGDLARPGADRRLRDDADRRRRHPALRHRRAEGRDPRRHRRRRRRGDRDDRARGGLRRRLADDLGRARSTAASSSTARRSSAPTPTSPTTSWSSAGPPRASPSTRACR